MAAPPLRAGRRWATAGWACGVMAGLGLAAAAPADAQSTPSLLQRLRQLLGVQQPVAVAGSRGLSSGGADANELCLISPWRTAAVEDIPGAITASGAPAIVTKQPLAELQILRGDTVLKRLRASSSQPLQTPLPWPVEPLAPGESVDLRMRLLNSGGGDFARVRLRRPAAVDVTRSQDIETAAALEQLFAGALAGDSAQGAQAMELIQNACSQPAAP